MYRDEHLDSCGIISLPTPLAQDEALRDPLFRLIFRDRASPGPHVDRFAADVILQGFDNGAAEADVQAYFQREFFDLTPPLRYDTGRLFTAQFRARIAGDAFISTPRPDGTVGYNRAAGGFPQRRQQLTKAGAEIVANGDGLLLPFLVVEYKGDDRTSQGKLYTAANQVMGGSATSVQMAESLNRRLEQSWRAAGTPTSFRSPPTSINTTIFSLVTNGMVARLCATRRHGDEYKMQRIGIYLLQRPENMIDLRKHIMNILDWGQNERLASIQAALDEIDGLEAFVQDQAT